MNHFELFLRYFTKHKFSICITDNINSEKTIKIVNNGITYNFNFYSNGSIKSLIPYKNNKIHGKVYLFYNNLKIYNIDKFIQNLKDGIYKIIGLRAKEHYRKDTENGTFLIYDEKGNLIKKTIYQKGYIVSEKILQEPQSYIEYKYKTRKLYNLSKEEYEQYGIIKTKLNSDKKGILHGKYEMSTKNGFFTCNYTNGVLIGFLREYNVNNILIGLTYYDKQGHVYKFNPLISNNLMNKFEYNHEDQKRHIIECLIQKARKKGKFQLSQKILNFYHNHIER